MPACKICHRIIEGNICPFCHSTDLSNEWQGYLIIIDPSRSNISKKLNIDSPGRYAIRVR
ncbi:MAG: DNA-directed RNA polymerase, subunit E'' [Candidatus Methanoliparum thermophilum]|uniref:Transcription elongation factor Spt4 n=1 Tax=Methanoliparum thermophilum TaxID=2491083 RepID=A0A520KRB6_METT2|nr:MAG: DNA-directed RNA polymerase, subunit E'' [Candidatus Methanoliparum thermophilum]BDC35616.1 DNA-directed RNA polymerase subunit E'' [Candidatus Methanoliparum sp. LAM-1]